MKTKLSVFWRRSTSASGMDEALSAILSAAGAPDVFQSTCCSSSISVKRPLGVAVGRGRQRRDVAFILKVKSGSPRFIVRVRVR